MKIAAFLDKIVERHTLAVLVVALIFAGFAAWSASTISMVTTQDAFISPESDAFKGYLAYDQTFGGAP